MYKEYDPITAFHYAAYRPPFHSNILKRFLKDKTYIHGLDIGSGTGQSTIALADFCSSVVGIEPSASMLSKAIAHPKVTYSLFDKYRIDFKKGTFNIITMAGSLWYAKSQRLLDEIARVSQKGAMILIYDFEVLLETILKRLGHVPKETNTPYNHLTDFSGLKTNGIEMVEKGFNSISLEIAPSDLGHLILSVKDWYNSLIKVYGTQNLYECVVEKLSLNSDSNLIEIQADTFFTLYRYNK